LRPSRLRGEKALNFLEKKAFDHLSRASRPSGGLRGLTRIIQGAEAEFIPEIREIHG